MPLSLIQLLLFPLPPLTKYVASTRRSDIRMWRQLHWAESVAELLGTSLRIFRRLSAVVFNFGKGLPMEQLIPERRCLPSCWNADLASLSQLSPANPDLLEHSRLVLLQSCE